MLMSAIRRSVPVRRVAAASVAQRDTWVRNFQSTPRAEADSMGNLIDKGKEGAEFVVSGTILFFFFFYYLIYVSFIICIFSFDFWHTTGCVPTT